MLSSAFEWDLNRVFPKWMSLNSANSVNHDKIQNSIITTRTTYLDIVTFLVMVIEITISLLPLGRYLLPLTTWNTCGVFLEIISILCFVTIHWIQWESFRKNSIIAIFVYYRKIRMFCPLWTLATFFALTLSHAVLGLNKVLPVHDISELLNMFYDWANATDKCREYIKIHVS